MEKVERIIRGKSTHNTMRHQTWAIQHGFRFNVPVDMITPIKKTIQRKNQNKLTDLEKQKYMNAIETLISNGEYGKMVAYHADMSYMQHGMMGPLGVQRFLG